MGNRCDFCDTKLVFEHSPWISVKDRLPKEREVVLLYITWPPETMFNCRANPLERTFIFVGGLIFDGKFVRYDRQYNDEGVKHVSHWMPLPAPPKDKEL